MQQAEFSQAVGVRLVTLAKDTVQTQSQDLIRMLSAGLDPNVGRQLDIKV